MKYRLKKDLPFAKAGEPVETYGELIRVIDSSTKLGWEIGFVFFDLPRLIEEGWIEEVKHEEVELHQHRDSYGNMYWSKVNAMDHTYVRSAKFREVTDED